MLTSFDSPVIRKENSFLFTVVIMFMDFDVISVIGNA